MDQTSQNLSDNIAAYCTLDCGLRDFIRASRVAQTRGESRDRHGWRGGCAGLGTAALASVGCVAAFAGRTDLNDIRQNVRSLVPALPVAHGRQTAPRGGNALTGAFLPYRNRNGQHGWRSILSTMATHFWLKCFGTMGFTLIFFSAYIYLLKHPAAEVAIMPVTLVDRLVGFEPLALPLYLSLWVYVSLPPMLMLTRSEIFAYVRWIGSMCLVALGIFYFWPSAVPPANIDWARYPGVAFLKGVDASGNACPSLHVATAVFSALWLHWRLPAAGLGAGSRLASACWCVAIAYSAMATKQHVWVDVIAGAALGVVFAWCSRAPLRRLQVPAPFGG
jgi:membrane-associated phospholipid phosphatase